MAAIHYSNSVKISRLWCIFFHTQLHLEKMRWTSGNSTHSCVHVPKTSCFECSEAKKKTKNNWRVALFMRSSLSVPLVPYTFLMAQKGHGSHRTNVLMVRWSYGRFLSLLFFSYIRNIRIRPVKPIVENLNIASHLSLTIWPLFVPWRRD